MDCWLSSEEINELLDTEEPTNLNELFVLRKILSNSFIDDNFQICKEWETAIQLSEAGKKYRNDYVESLDIELPEEVLRFQIFLMFYHLDILIDSLNCDVQLIHDIIHNGIKEKTILIPMAYGRYLYDKFNDDFTLNRTDHLLPADVKRLLNGQPQGVFQVGRKVTGPLGIVESHSHRLVPPTLEIPLWHCSDPGCSALHSVSLLNSNREEVSRINKWEQKLIDEIGPPSEWNSPLTRASKDVEGPRIYTDLPIFLVEGLVESERKGLFLFLLKTDSQKKIRNTLNDLGISNQGSPEKIVESLPILAICQLLLTLDDKTLIALIDDCIKNNILSLQPNEIRSSKRNGPKYNYGDTYTELSKWGSRSTRGNPTANLARLIFEAYKNVNLIENLEWRLRGRKGRSVRAALMQYLHEENPLDAITELVLSDQTISKYFEENLQGLRLNGDRESDAHVILWKLGHNLPQFEDTYERVRKRLTTVFEVIESADNDWTEDDREAIRGVGVNLFVSVEQVLEELITYLVWILSSDHFGETKFVFRYTDALKNVSDILGANIKSGSVEFSWSETGRNTLGTLIVYLQSMEDWIQSLVESDPTNVKRHDDNLPHYINDKHREFTFWHTELWADCNKDDLRELSSRIKEITELVEKAELAKIRNGIDHKRSESEFPKKEDLIEAVTKFRDAFDLCDHHRLIPKKFWIESRQLDRFGRSIVHLFDYKGKKLTLKGPSTAVLGKTANLESFTLIAPGNLLGIPNAHLFFSRVHSSPIDDYWKNYPRRRKIPTPISKETV